MVAGSGHAPHEERPEETLALLRSFLAAAERPRRPVVVAVPS
jgi:hypothetical protein